MENIEKIIQEELKNFNSEWIYIFGSCVNNTTRKDSDIDIAFFSTGNLDEYEIFLKAQKISDRLGKDVDLIHINKASTVFQNQIITKGKVIYDKFPEKRKNFEILVLKKYIDLNVLRKDILDNYEEEVNEILNSK